MGSKSAGGRVGFGTEYSKGPRNMGVGGKIVGGTTRQVLARIDNGSGHFSLSHFARHAGLSAQEALAEVDTLVASGEANYTFFSPEVARVLALAGNPAPVRNGLAVRGFSVA